MGDFNFSDWFDQNYDPSDTVPLNLGTGDITGNLGQVVNEMPSGSDMPYGAFQGPLPEDAMAGMNNVSGFLSKLFGGSQPGQNLADLSKLFGGFSSGQKANRVTQGNFTQAYDRNMLDAQQARNQNESDAIRKLGITNFLQNGAAPSAPPQISLNGKSYSPQGAFTPPPTSAAQKQGASTLESQLLARLMPGGSYTPQPLSSYAQPGAAEQIGNYGGLATGAGGALANIFG